MVKLLTIPFFLFLMMFISCLTEQEVVIYKHTNIACSLLPSLALLPSLISNRSSKCLGREARTPAGAPCGAAAYYGARVALSSLRK
jgi:hypothetical protein